MVRVSAPVYGGRKLTGACLTHSQHLNWNMLWVSLPVYCYRLMRPCLCKEEKLRAPSGSVIPVSGQVFFFLHIYVVYALKKKKKKLLKTTKTQDIRPIHCDPLKNIAKLHLMFKNSFD